jgi:hypothetical protein
MPVPGFTAGRMLLADTYLSSHTTVKPSDLTTTAFFTKGVHVNSSSDEDEEGAGYCTVIGKLIGGNEIVTLNIATKSPVPIAFSEIVKEGTTGVGIFFTAE